MINKNILFGVLFLTYGGGGNYLFGTESVYRGKYSIVEVVSDAVKTELPNTGTWKSGTLNAGLRCFDLLCTGKCNLTSTSLKLKIESIDKIPNFFTKNSDGKIVFSTPSPMSVITTPRGHGTWIQIELKTINGVAIDSLSGIAKHICLGIKKRSENDYFDVIHAGKLTSEYVDLFDTDAVELIPLLSKTAVTSDGYELIKTGEKITPSNFGLTGTSFDFGSVYRVNIADKGAWIEKSCNLSTLDASGYWFNCGSLAVGPLAGQEGEQLLAIRTNGKLAYSKDGISWFNAGNFNSSPWDTGIKYGNGIWCAVRWGTNPLVKRSVDNGKNWLDTNNAIGDYTLVFGDDIFMMIDRTTEETYNKVYTSTDGEMWTEVGAAPKDNRGIHGILIYGDNKWICGTWEGTIYQSKNGKEWERIGEISQTIKTYWYGGCYANGYFYVVNENGLIVRSATGERWEEIIKTSTRRDSITYYKNKLYTINNTGTACYIGIPNS